MKILHIAANIPVNSPSTILNVVDESPEYYDPLPFMVRNSLSKDKRVGHVTSGKIEAKYGSLIKYKRH